MPLFLYIYRAIEYKVKKKEEEMRPPPLTFNARTTLPIVIITRTRPIIILPGQRTDSYKTGLLFSFFQARRDNGNKVKLSRCSSNNTHTHTQLIRPAGFIDACLWHIIRQTRRSVSPSTGGRLFSLTVPTLEEWFITTERKRNPRGFSRVYIQSGYLYNGQIIPCVTDGTTRKRISFWL